VFLVVNGVAALEVFTISNFPSGVLTNQVHPEPKLLIQEFVNSSTNDSNDPKLSSIADNISPLGFPPAFGANPFQ
jgi:hypothetical protein